MFFKKFSLIDKSSNALLGLMLGMCWCVQVNADSIQAPLAEVQDYKWVPTSWCSRPKSTIENLDVTIDKYNKSEIAEIKKDLDSLSSLKSLAFKISQDIESSERYPLALAALTQIRSSKLSKLVHLSIDLNDMYIDIERASALVKGIELFPKHLNFSISLNTTVKDLKELKILAESLKTLQHNIASFSLTLNINIKGPAEIKALAEALKTLPQKLTHIRIDINQDSKDHWKLTDSEQATLRAALKTLLNVTSTTIGYRHSRD